MTTLPPLVLDEDRTDLGAALSDALDSSLPTSSAREDSALAASIWKTLADELGVAGVAVPTEQGGEGGDWLDVGVVAYEIGTRVVPSPYLGRSVLAPAALAAAGWPIPYTPALGVAVSCTQTPWDNLRPVGLDGGRLTGTVPSVIDVDGTGALLVPTQSGLVSVSTSGPGLDVRRRVSLDETRPISDVHFDGAPAELLAEVDVSATMLEVACCVLAMEQAGIARGALDQVLAYVKERRQFGRTIGSYQAVKHRLADLHVRTQQALAVARFAVGVAAADEAERRVAASLAKAFCTEVAVGACEELVQLHGGIGFTWEHPAHWFLKRAKADAQLFGTPFQHRTSLARDVLEGVGA